MKKILITGTNSYIGNSFADYLSENFPGQYTADKISLRDGTWREKNFSGYDAVFHVSGIAHRKETEENAHLYYEVNRDLTAEIAGKAKKDGVEQFIFLSSMSVYGMDTGVITPNTQPEPKSNYGKSKLEAEQRLEKLAGADFRVCVLRPPMVYGKDCKGNFQTVVKLVKRLPFFPKIKNQRSMIYIENLCEFVRLCVDKELEGLYFPQNREYGETYKMAKIMAEKLNKRLYGSIFLGGVQRSCVAFCLWPRRRLVAWSMLIQKNLTFRTA